MKKEDRKTVLDMASKNTPIGKIICQYDGVGHGSFTVEYGRRWSRAVT